MRQSLARFSEPVSSVHAPSWADFITATPAFKLSVHTTLRYGEGTGHFFGEISVLRRARRSATVTAVVPTRLLVLDALDLHGLMDRQPELAARIQEAARAKLGHELNAPDGDLVSEELSGAPSD